MALTFNGRIFVSGFCDSTRLGCSYKLASKGALLNIKNIIYFSLRSNYSVLLDYLGRVWFAGYKGKKSYEKHTKIYSNVKKFEATNKRLTVYTINGEVKVCNF